MVVLSNRCMKNESIAPTTTAWPSTANLCLVSYPTSDNKCISIKCYSCMSIVQSSIFSSPYTHTERIYNKVFQLRPLTIVTLCVSLSTLFGVTSNQEQRIVPFGLHCIDQEMNECTAAVVALLIFSSTVAVNLVYMVEMF